MFSFFKKSKEKQYVNDNVYDYLPAGYDDTKVRVFYEGEVLSADYTATTLVFNEGGDIRKYFNDQGFPYHVLHPHGKGKIVYKHGDEIIEEYEGDFEAGQYNGEGELVDRHGEILKGKFIENKFVG